MVSGTTTNIQETTTVKFQYSIKVFAIESKKNAQNCLKKLLIHSSIFQQHIYMRSEYISNNIPHHSKLTVEVNIRTQVSYTKLDIKYICKKIKPCHCHSSHCFLAFSAALMPAAQQHKRACPQLWPPQGWHSKVSSTSAESQDWVWCEFGSNRRWHLCKWISTQEDGITQLVATQKSVT